MNLKDNKYNKFTLVREMFETIEVINNFDIKAVTTYTNEAKNAGRLFLTGEGSNRIFPAKNVISKALQWGMRFPVFTDGGRQADEYFLEDSAVFASSSNGNTREIVDLYKKLKKKRHQHLFLLTAEENCPLAEFAKSVHLLSCGTEKAGVSTKSVVEEALFYHTMTAGLAGRRTECRGLQGVSTAFKKVLELALPKPLIKSAAKASRIYFAGRNDGVAESLALKANEIIRKPSIYLEGSYATHGVIEVMQKDEVVVWFNPYEKELKKVSQYLKDAGVKLIAVSQKKLSVPTIQLPGSKNFEPYLQVAAGWNLLVEIALLNKIDLNKSLAGPECSSKK